MLKERHVQNMQQARTSIVRQLHSLKLLVSGLDIDRSHFTPVLAETAFGKWFYGEAVHLASEEIRQSLGDIEKTLQEFHAHFMEIYAAYYVVGTGRLLGLLGLKRKPSPAQKASAQRLYEKIVPLADQLRKQMNSLEAIMEKIPEEAFCPLSAVAQKRLATS